jgi:hypothetical protein
LSNYKVCEKRRRVEVGWKKLGGGKNEKKKVGAKLIVVLKKRKKGNG